MGQLEPNVANNFLGVSGLEADTKVYGKTTENTQRYGKTTEKYDEMPSPNMNSNSEEIDVPGIKVAAKKKCPNANIDALTDAQVISAGQSVMNKYQDLSIEEFMVKGTQIQDEILGAVCNLGGGSKSSEGSGWSMPTWGYAAIVGGVLLLGWMVFRKK